jgi:hypothetical protein
MVNPVLRIENLGTEKNMFVLQESTIEATGQDSYP